jgi:hypothetical protein
LKEKIMYQISIFSDGTLRDVYGPDYLDPDIQVYPITDDQFVAIQADPNFGHWKLVSGELQHLPDTGASAPENKAEAERRLAATDWVNQPDVYDPANTPHLTNRDAFLTYRAEVRVIAVTPVDGTLNWPTEPTAVWSS